MSDPRRRPPPPPPPPPEPTSTSSSPPQDDNTNDNTNDNMNTNFGIPEGAGDALPEKVKNGGKPANLLTDTSPGGFKLKFCTVCASNNNRSMEAHLRLTTTPSAGPTGYPTISFGTGSLVRLPGPSISQPNVYNFNSTSYADMYNELAEKDKRLYSANGILPMLERNKNVKWGPERWQDWRVGVPRVGPRSTPLQGQGGATQKEYQDDKGAIGTEAGTVDVVITCEERCWDAVVDDLLTRGSPLNRPVHVFNVDIKDNHEEALVGGRAILELADALNAAAREERDACIKESGESSLGGSASNSFDEGTAGARAGFDERVPEILAEWQEKWPQLPALWTLAWF